MKLARPLALAIALTFGGLSLSAQTPAASSAAPAAKPAAGTPKVVPTARLAWLNSQAFVAEEGGVKQLVRVLKELELEFSSQQSELSLGNEKLRTLVGELNKLRAGGAANADAIKQKETDGLKMQQELQAKQQQFQAAVSQAQQEKQAPVVAELTKAISAYAKERDLGMILDVSKLGDGVIAAQPELDVTEDFIAYFNASHK